MYHWGLKSQRVLSELRPELQEILNEAIKIINLSLHTGYRGQEEQDEAYEKGLSQVPWPNSKHNKSPSDAVDLSPYPWDPEDRELFTYCAGIVVGIAAAKGYDVIWGGNWDMDTDLEDNEFDDLMHIEFLGRL